MVNVLLHAGAMVVFFWVLARMTGSLWSSAGDGAVRYPSLAGGVGGLGDRAEGRVERIVLFADAGRLLGATCVKRERGEGREAAGFGDSPLSLPGSAT